MGGGVAGVGGRRRAATDCAGPADGLETAPEPPYLGGFPPNPATTLPSAGELIASYQYVYQMDGVSKTFPGGKQVLKDIRLFFLQGAKIGVLGLNGSVKSTLITVMAGIDTDINGEGRPADGIRIGYLS